MTDAMSRMRAIRKRPRTEEGQSSSDRASIRTSASSAPVPPVEDVSTAAGLPDQPIEIDPGNFPLEYFSCLCECIRGKFF